MLQMGVSAGCAPRFAAVASESTPSLSNDRFLPALLSLDYRAGQPSLVQALANPAGLQRLGRAADVARVRALSACHELLDATRGNVS